MLGITVYAGDTAPIPAMILTDQGGAPVDLNPLTSLKFRMVDARDGGVAIDNADATKIQSDNDPATFGQVAYQWTVEDTARPGLYQVWFIVDQGGGPARYPLDDNFYVLIKLGV